MEGLNILQKRLAVAGIQYEENEKMDIISEFCLSGKPNTSKQDVIVALGRVVNRDEDVTEKFRVLLHQWSDPFIKTFRWEKFKFVDFEDADKAYLRIAQLYAAEKRKQIERELEAANNAEAACKLLTEFIRLGVQSELTDDATLDRCNTLLTDHLNHLNQRQLATAD